MEVGFVTPLPANVRVPDATDNLRLCQVQPRQVEACRLEAVTRAVRDDKIIREPHEVTCGVPISPRVVPRIRPAGFMSSFWQGTEELMQTKNTFTAFSLLLTGCLALSLAACQSFSWHLAAGKKGGAVELCLSNGDECPQAGGVSLSSIAVYRWDNMHDNELVWDAESKNPITAANISGVVTYGVPPEGWINKLAPPALICGKAYLVNPGAHYFALKCDGTVVVFDAPHLEEFFRENTTAEPDRMESSGPETKRTTH